MKRLLAQVWRQQQDLAERFAKAPPIPLARVRANPDGSVPFGWCTLTRRLEAWLGVCDVRDATGQSVRVTAHQFRHTLGKPMFNNEVLMDSVQRMLDHASPEMTARYAAIKDQTLRREWERYQQRINVRGEVVCAWTRAGRSGDAAWARENLGCAKQTLPNGYCGLALQQQTTAEFLAIHGEQLQRTEQLQARARERGNQRLVEMNGPVRVNLTGIIDGLQTLTGAGEEEDRDG